MVRVGAKPRTQDIRQLGTWSISWHLWRREFLIANETTLPSVSRAGIH